MPPIIKQTILLQGVHAQSSRTLCDPTDCSVHGVSRARILQWVAISFSRGSSPPREQTRVSCGSCIGRRVLYSSAWAQVVLSNAQMSPCLFLLRLQHLQLLSFMIFIHLMKKIFWIADPGFPHCLWPSPADPETPLVRVREMVFCFEL